MFLLPEKHLLFSGRSNENELLCVKDLNSSHSPDLQFPQERNGWNGTPPAHPKRCLSIGVSEHVEEPCVGGRALQKLQGHLCVHCGEATEVNPNYREGSWHFHPYVPLSPQHSPGEVSKSCWLARKPPEPRSSLCDEKGIYRDPSAQFRSPQLLTVVVACLTRY